MRNLFLALVLANLGFAAWHAWWGTGKPPPASPEGGARLELLSEVEGDDAEAGADGASAQEISASPAQSQDSASQASAAQASAAQASAGQAGAGPGAAGSRAAPSPPGAPAPGSAAPRRRVNEDRIRAAVAAAEGTNREPSAEPDAVPVQAASAPDRCVSVGPFLDLGQATTASAKLRAAGYEPSQRAGEGDVWVGYWVYLDAIPSQEEANRILSVLHENGIGEAYVFQGDDGKVISLGVFTEIARAGRLRDQVRALGFEPLVVDRTRREDVYWIDLVLKAGREVDFEALQTPGRITRLEQRPCENSRAAAAAR